MVNKVNYSCTMLHEPGSVISPSLAPGKVSWWPNFHSVALYYEAFLGTFQDGLNTGVATF